MRPISSLARMLQGAVLALLLLAFAWLGLHAVSSPWVALIGFVLIVGVHAMVLGIEFIGLHFIAQSDPSPRATARALARAWWAETIDAVRVFGWRQPFRWAEVPDHLPDQARGRRGVVFIHGFVCNRGLWTPWLHRLRYLDVPFVAVNLEPVFTSIDRYVPIVDEAVRRVAEVTGLPPVLVCHSMGGLAARAWLRAQPDGAATVHHLVTIGTPHRGTWLARWSHLPNGRQMRLDSEWLQQLARDEADAALPPTTCWYSNCDNIVFPPSTATLPGADNRLFAGAAHVELAFVPPVMEATLAQVTAQGEFRTGNPERSS